VKSLVYTSREEIEVHRFSPMASVGIPIIALMLQATLPVRFRFMEVFDLPLLVTIFFAIARRNQVAGLFTGSVIGLLQDSLSHQPLGIFGIAKTVVGYGASSLGVRIDVENPGSRLLMTIFFYFVHQSIYFMVANGLVQRSLEWRWGHTILAALANGLLAVVLFAMLDKFKKRA
jgi:rod shape-determining protein MreD